MLLQGPCRKGQKGSTFLDMLSVGGSGLMDRRDPTQTVRDAVDMMSTFACTGMTNGAKETARSSR